VTTRAASSPGVNAGPAQTAEVNLIQPVDLYSRVDRSAKYGFLFIGFTFLALLMFDVIGGVRVSAVEYLLMGAALGAVLRVLLLAFAEVIGFTPAYLLASAAIAGLNTAYAAAGAQELAPRGLHRRSVNRPLCGAVHPAQPRGLSPC
jgi:inner membrane protein